MMSHRDNRLPSRSWTALTRALTALVASLMSIAAQPESARACTSDAECKGDRVCLDGACQDRPPCQADVDCAGEEICSAGRCALPSSPAPDAAGFPAAPHAGPSAPTPNDAAAKRAEGAEDQPLVPSAGTAEGPRLGQTDAPAYATETRGITGLIIAGPIVLGVAWALGLVGTLAADADGELVGFSAIPLAGPWILLADSRTEDYAAALVVGGVLQAAGLTMTVLGLSIRQEVQVPLASLRLTPTLGGLVLDGMF